MGVPRKVVQIAAAASLRTLWLLRAVDGWLLVEALPDAEACAAKARDVDGECRLAKGHREHHWSGSRRWA